MAHPTYGTMGVDWEQRVDFDRLRRERLARAKEHLDASELGALLCFDMNNIRYLTATHIGTWAMDKLVRFALLPQGDEPILWDFGSAARHHAALLPVARRGAVARRHLDAARGGALEGSRRVGRREDPRRARAARSRSTSRSASTWSSCPCCARSRRRGSRSSTGRQLMQAGADDQDGGRDHAPDHGLRDGRRRLRRALQGAAARDPRERVRRARQQGALRARLGARRGGERDLGRALQPAPARLHRPDAAARATPRTSTSSTPSTATAPATTGRSRSAAPRRRRSTPTSAAATSSTRRSR